MDRKAINKTSRLAEKGTSHNPNSEILVINRTFLDNLHWLTPNISNITRTGTVHRPSALEGQYGNTHTLHLPASASCASAICITGIDIPLSLHVQPVDVDAHPKRD